MASSHLHCALLTHAESDCDIIRCMCCSPAMAPTLLPPLEPDPEACPLFGLTVLPAAGAALGASDVFTGQSGSVPLSRPFETSIESRLKEPMSLAGMGPHSPVLLDRSSSARLGKPAVLFHSAQGTHAGHGCASATAVSMITLPFELNPSLHHTGTSASSTTSSQRLDLCSRVKNIHMLIRQSCWGVKLPCVPGQLVEM